MGILDGDLVANPDGLISYSVVPGNHDYDAVGNNLSADRFIEFFGPSRYNGRSWYGGQSAVQTSFFQIFNAGGRDFLHIGLEWNTKPPAIAWAQSVIDANPQLPVILATHNYLSTSGRSNIGEPIFQGLVKANPQVFMVLSGHYAGENQQISQNDIGLDVIEILADYQGRSNGGDGWLRLMEFSPSSNSINVQTYSPTLDQFETDSDSQFTININFDQRFDFTSPKLSISDMSEIESDSGTSTDFVFTVTRSFDTTGTASVDWSTLGNTAIEGTDYVGNSGQLTFAPGVTEQTITISINGDDFEEGDEDFSIILSAPVGATLGDGLGVGTILNDDTTLSINDVTVAEGDTSVGFIDDFVSAGNGGLNAPRTVLFGPDGNMYVGSGNSDEVLRYDGETGAFLGAFVSAGSGGLDFPAGMLFGPDANSDGIPELYVSSRDTDSIMRYDGATGTPLPSAGNSGATFVSSGSAGLNLPIGLAIGSAGDLFVASRNSHSILRYDGDTGDFVSEFITAGSGGLIRPNHLVFGTDGNLYVSSHPNGVLRYDDTGAFIDNFIPDGSGGMNYAEWLQFDGGLLYVSSGGDDKAILRFDASSGAFVDTFVTSASGGLTNPWCFTFGSGSDSNLYVSSSTGHEILRYGVASQAAFIVSLSSPSALPVTVDFTTADGSAKVIDGNYTANSGTITFDPGVTTRTIIVSTIDDAVEELTENFFVYLSAATGAVILDSQGEATINDDDGGISVSPNSAIPNEQLTVTITGSDFVDGATVNFGSRVAVQSVTFVDSTQLDVLIKVHRRATIGSRDVTVTNPDDSTATCTDCFTVVATSSSSATSDQSSGPVQSFIFVDNDETSTETSIIQPTDPTPLNVELAWAEEESDDESPVEDDTEIIAKTDQTDLDSLFGDLDGSLQDELLVV